MPSHFPRSFLTSHCFLAPIAAGASQLNVPPQATEAHSGDVFRATGSGDPCWLATWRPPGREHPLGYLIEADVLWWKIYASGWRENTTRLIPGAPAPPEPDDDAYLALADKVTQFQPHRQKDTPKYCTRGWGMRPRQAVGPAL